jgi:hypothetical protein
MEQSIITFVFAYLGGLGANSVRLIELSRKSKAERSVITGEAFYWVVFFCFPLFGGVLALAYTLSNTTLNAILSLHVGASWPLIFKSLASIAPVEHGQVG